MKMKRRILLALLSLFVVWGMAGMAQATSRPAAPPTVTFEATDKPGSWFECSNTGSSASTIGCADTVLGQQSVGKSLAVIQPGESVGFVSKGQANTIHTAVSLMYPHGAFSAPFDVDLQTPAHGGTGKPYTVTLNTPGLYVFFCDIHVYMFAAVIVDDPKTTVQNPTGGGNPATETPLYDLGKTLDLPSVTQAGIGVGLLPGGIPTFSDLVIRLVHTFFIATNPQNWQDFNQATWSPSYPAVPVLAYDEGGNPVSISSQNPNPKLTNLNDALQYVFSEPKNRGDKGFIAYLPPSSPGVGQVWVNTQFEKMKEKSKPGTATAVNAEKWIVERKVGLPFLHDHQGMNNPHNMWTDKDQKVIYQTQWFDEYLAVFDRETGHFRYNLPAGPAPAHVMTRTLDNNGNISDQVHVSQNGGNNVREFDSLKAGNGFIQDIAMQKGTKLDPHPNSHPHGHFMSADGTMMVTPNEDADQSGVYDFRYGLRNPVDVGHSPLATGMMPGPIKAGPSKGVLKYYVANFLDSTLSVIGITKHDGNPPVANELTKINLLLRGDNSGYDPITIGGCSTNATCTNIGGLPIQTPVSPDGKYVVVANTLTASILVIETSGDTIVASVPCDPGCHGVQFGAKASGGYYAYVASKFSNRVLVIDMDKIATGCAGTPSPCIAGSVLLSAPNLSMHAGNIDGTVTDYAGMGGQGVLPIPLVYNGWVQNLPHEWKEKLTTQQLNPFPTH